MSELTHPLRQLLKNNNEYIWQEDQEKAFRDLKDLICKAPVLNYFDTNLPVTLSASQNGLGAILLQNNKPYAYASSAMTSTQQNYAQIEKELLAICFGVNKYHQYIYGSKFTVETDHKPLISIFNKPLNSCPARLQKMLTLQKYDINLIYRPGKELIIADSLSRNNSKTIFEDNLDLEAQICLIEKNISLTDEKLNLISFSNKDEILNKIKHYISNGWPSSSKKVSEEIKPYFKMKSEITQGRHGLLYMGQRLIIPKGWEMKF